jgi:hypothetical protein
MEIKIEKLLISSLDGGERLASLSGRRFAPRENATFEWNF